MARAGSIPWSKARDSRFYISWASGLVGESPVPRLGCPRFESRPVHKLRSVGRPGTDIKKFRPRPPARALVRGPGGRDPRIPAARLGAPRRGSRGGRGCRSRGFARWIPTCRGTRIVPRGTPEDSRPPPQPRGIQAPLPPAIGGSRRGHRRPDRGCDTGGCTARERDTAPATARESHGRPTPNTR